MKNYILFFIIILTTISRSQPTGDPIVITGDQLIGGEINGRPTREFLGNVVVNHQNVVITCNRAIQYLDQNYAQLIGNVIVRQDTLTIKTQEGFYYGNEKRAYSDKGVVLDDKKVILKALKGEYLFNEYLASFKYDVSLTDSFTVLKSDDLHYNRRSAVATAFGNVSIVDSLNTIYCDSLQHHRSKQETFGFGNVKISNSRDNAVIVGGRFEDFRRTKVSRVFEDPLLFQIEKSDSAQADTLLIAAEILEAVRDTADVFYARDSVSILRGDFSSVNSFTVYHKKLGIITTAKQRRNEAYPVMWNGTSEISGDSIVIVLLGNKLELAKVFRNALITSFPEAYPKRYDQIAGRNIFLSFIGGKLSETNVQGNVLSIYYMYENDAPNGLIKSSGAEAIIRFNENQVEEVRLYGDPKSEFHPEDLVVGNEKKFLIPEFRTFSNRPKKETLLLNRTIE